MPTPIAHSLCGYAIYESTTRRGERWRLGRFFGLIVVANLADMDYLPGFIINQPNIFHHGMSHSLLFTIMFGLLVGTVSTYFNQRFWPTMLLITLAYSSHIFMDLVTVDTSAPFGEQLFWPFSTEYYLSPLSLFRDIDKGGTNTTFFANAFGLYNLKTAALECAIFLPIIMIIRLIKTKWIHE